ncbi:MAG TPA: tRNA uracil 4-sulfurtransferase ThiI [Clostridia bacterium]|nr:tRNA uracil 4-sulfurtransferase ThiI [Clostridia bacterium]
MEKILLIRYAEIHLKGLNKPFFERKLLQGINGAFGGTGASSRYEQGRIYVRGLKETDEENVLKKLQKVFGIHSVSPALSVDKNMDAILNAAKALVERALEGKEQLSFKVFARRGDKRFPLDSQEICRELGHLLLEEYPEKLSVDVHAPDISVTVEVRDSAYVYCEEIPCAGGMPTGTAGRAALLISGGIDSPVAGYLMAKRGLELSAVHFYSYPYTSERARDKVVALTKLLSEYSGEVRLHLVPFTEIQLAIYDRCPPKETTVIMRRLMMKIAETIGGKDGALALITGEALGQVASQTLESLCATDDAVHMPVFRPLIGFDKDEIVTVAKKINTFETSILPYEDCCTVFVPEHPVTKPTVAGIRGSEAKVDFSVMIETALKNTEVITVI